MKKFKKKSKLLIAIISTIVIIGIVITIIVAITSSKEKEETKDKPILYKYDIEDIDYSKLEFQMYSIKYKSKSDSSLSNYDIDTSVQFILKSDNSCTHWATATHSSGVTNIKENNSCVYERNEENITITYDTIKTWIPSPSYGKLGYKTETTYADTMTVSGTLSDNGKFLTIGNLKYSHSTYNFYIANDYRYVLIDPTDNKDYTLQGLECDGYIDESERKSIDLTKYQIIDKTSSNNNTTNPIDNSDSLNNETSEYTIQSYIGQNYLVVKNLLENNSIKVLIEEKSVNSSDTKYKKDIIMDQSVMPGTKLTSNDKITLYIPKFISIYPNMVSEKWSLSDVEAFAVEYDLQLQVEYENDSSATSGTIIYQSSSAGTEIKTGTTLKVKIAT